MIDEIRVFLKQYTEWINSTYTIDEIEDLVEVTVPFVDRHNDALQIFVRRDNGEYIISDLGYILQDLKSSGCEIDTPKRQSLLSVTLNGFNVFDNNGHLSIKANKDNFVWGFHCLLQAMIAVNDLYYLAEPITSQLFIEDIAKWLSVNKIGYEKTYKLRGLSGLDRTFDFFIPKKNGSSDKLIQSINEPNRQNIEKSAWIWNDITNVYHGTFLGFVIINNKNKRVTDQNLRICHNYNLNPLLWSDREESIAELTS